MGCCVCTDAEGWGALCRVRGNIRAIRNDRLCYALRRLLRYATRYADGVAHEDAWGCLVACGNVLYQRRPHSQQCQLVDIGVLQLPRRVESTYTFWSKKTKRKSTGILLVFYRSAVLQKYSFVFSRSTLHMQQGFSVPNSTLGYRASFENATFGDETRNLESDLCSRVSEGWILENTD